MVSGKVLGGQHVDSPVDINRKGELTIQLRAIGQLVLQERKLTGDEVAAWQEISAEAQTGALGLFGAAGRAAAGAALPGLVGRAASAAIGAGVNAAARTRHVRIDWVSGQQSLLRLSEKLFAHLRLTLGSLELSREGAEPQKPAQDAPASATDQVLAQVAGLIGDRRAASGHRTAGAQSDIGGQLLQLTTLRDQGALSPEEFAAAKARLLG